jgi:hypothetical protein
MHVTRMLAVKLLRRQEWGGRAVAPLPRRRGALSPARRRRLAAPHSSLSRA